MARFSIPDHFPLAEIDAAGIVTNATPAALGCLRSTEAIPADAVGVGAPVAPDLLVRVRREFVRGEPAAVQLLARDGNAGHLELHAWNRDPAAPDASPLIVFVLPENDAIDPLWLHILAQ